MTKLGLDFSAVDAFRGDVRGDLLVAGDADYEDARAFYNGMIDKRPALIARCRDVADVIGRGATSPARQGLDVAVRGGGHNGGGLGSCRRRAGHRPLAHARRPRGPRCPHRAVAGGGALLGDVDHATHAFGLATPSGIISTTGVGGLDPRRRLGHLTRNYGLTIDNLLEVDMVLADGRFVTASAEEHADLFWAVRGGGGNFGVVTSFLFRLHPDPHSLRGPDALADGRSRRRDALVPRLHPAARPRTSTASSPS